MHRLVEELVCFHVHSVGSVDWSMPAFGPTKPHFWHVLDDTALQSVLHLQWQLWRLHGLLLILELPVRVLLGIYSKIRWSVIAFQQDLHF